MKAIISAKKLFDGNQWHNQVALLYNLENKEIISMNTMDYEEIHAVEYVIPGLIDLQIYGAEGRLLSEYPDLMTLQAIKNYCQRSGTFYYQPTIASQSLSVIKETIDAVRAFKREEDSGDGGLKHQGCIGLHLEGPWIHVLRRGAHVIEHIHSPTLEEVKEIVDYGKGVISMITLAPEVCSLEIIEYLIENGIIVSAGHTNATYEEAMIGFEKIPTATHLFNAMSPFQHRAPGMVGAILNHATVMSSIVVDGYHVDYASIQIAKKLMKERLYCITDAVTETSTGPYQHYRENDRYLSQGILSGSALTQLKSIQNLVNHVGIELPEAIRMCSVYPARVLKRTEISGALEIGKACPFVCIDAQFNLILQT